MMAIIHSLKCTVPFSFAVSLLSLTITHCHLLSLSVTSCHSLSLVVTRCHSLSLVVPLVFIRYHSLSLDVPPVCLFINDQYCMIEFNVKKNKIFAGCLITFCITCFYISIRFISWFEAAV